MSEWDWVRFAFLLIGAGTLVAIGFSMLAYRNTHSLALSESEKLQEVKAEVADLRVQLAAALNDAHRARVALAITETQSAAAKAAADRRILTLEAQLALLLQHQAHPTSPPSLPVPARQAGRFLAILASPSRLPALNVAADEAALRAAGGPWELDILANATRRAVADNVTFNGPARIAYVAAHNAVELEDGPLSPTKLAQFVRELQAEVVILNGCKSADLASRLLTAGGAKVVIGTVRDIDDADAPQLATHLVEALASGKTIREAYRYLKLIVDEEVSEAVRIDGDDGWKWGAS